jgi:hypothetical protein
VAAAQAWRTSRKRKYHMSIKKVFAVAATITMVGGVSAVGLLPAVADTPPCNGNYCDTAYVNEFGPSFVFDVLRQGERAGQPVILFRTSNTDPAEDFTYAEQGTVSTLYAAGLVSKSLDLHYGDYSTIELEYAPYGVDSGLCVGVGSTAADGTPVALEPCGESSKTVWVNDCGDVIGNYCAQINGSDTNFSDPYVLHYPGNAYPTDLPRPQLNTWTLQRYSDGTPYDNEVWDSFNNNCLTALPLVSGRSSVLAC